MQHSCHLDAWAREVNLSEHHIDNSTESDTPTAPHTLLPWAREPSTFLDTSMKCSFEQVFKSKQRICLQLSAFLDTLFVPWNIDHASLFSGWGGRLRSLSTSALEADHQVLSAVARRRPSRRVGVAMVNEGECEVHARLLTVWTCMMWRWVKCTA